MLNIKYIQYYFILLKILIKTNKMGGCCYGPPGRYCCGCNCFGAQCCRCFGPNCGCCGPPPPHGPPMGHPMGMGPGRYPPPPIY